MLQARSGGVGAGLQGDTVEPPGDVCISLEGSAFTPLPSFPALSSSSVYQSVPNHRPAVQNLPEPAAP